MTALHNMLLNNPRERIGANNPPEQIELLKGAQDALADFLKNHPVIANEREAKEAKLLKDRADAALKDMEDERDALVRPLNTEVKDINERYRSPRDIFKKVLDTLNKRLADFIKAEKDRREAKALAIRRAAEQAEQIARDAEATARALMADQEQGVCDVDVAQATEQATLAFNEFKLLDRSAQRAEREQVVRIGGGFRHRTGLRTVEILSVTDWKAAIEEMGLTATITDAILSSARNYRKNFGELPAGIKRDEDHTV